MIKGFTFLSWNQSRHLKMNAVFQGLAWALGISLCICFALALWAIFSPAKTYYFPALLGSGALLGVFAGGLAAGAAAKNAGWFHGGLVGFCCGLIFLLLALLGELELFDSLDLAGRLGLSTLGGLAGGVVGVNLSVPAVNRKFNQKFALVKKFSRQAIR